MRRPPPTVALNASLLRHFLVITLAITACIAMFANGENGKLVQEQIQARAEKNRLLIAEKQAGHTKTINGLVIAKDTKLDGSGNTDTSDYNTVFNPNEVHKYQGTVAAAPELVAMAGPDGGIPAYTGPQGTPLTAPVGGQPELGKKSAKPLKPSANDIARILAASRARSGVPARE